jgi:hypothetical protein
MATFDSFRDMYDIALKPRLLNTLIRDNLPTVDHPFSNPSQLSNVVSLIKTHSLLSEDVTESMDPKQVKAWKSSVASWVDRVLLLLSSHEVNFIAFHYYGFWVFNSFLFRRVYMLILLGFIFAIDDF